MRRFGVSVAGAAMVTVPAMAQDRPDPQADDEIVVQGRAEQPYRTRITTVGKSTPGQAITNAVGTRFANAPAHQLGCWTRYQVPVIDTAFALGGEHVSRRISLSGQAVRPHTIVDASITKQLGFAELMLRIGRTAYRAGRTTRENLRRIKSGPTNSTHRSRPSRQCPAASAPVPPSYRPAR